MSIRFASRISLLRVAEALGICGLAWLIFAVSSRATVRIITDSTITATPYTLEQTTVSLDKSGRETRRIPRTIYQRTDGAITVMEEFGLVGKALTWRRVQLPDGSYSVIMKTLGAMSSGRLPERQRTVRALRYKTDTCVYRNEKLIRTELVEGHPTVMIITESPNRLSPRLTLWRYTDLGCQTARAFVDVHDNGQWRRSIELSTVRLSIGQPNPEVFDIPHGLPNVRPSAMRDLYDSYAGIDVAKCPKCLNPRFWERLDRFYDLTTVNSHTE